MPINSMMTLRSEFITGDLGLLPGLMYSCYNLVDKIIIYFWKWMRDSPGPGSPGLTVCTPSLVWRNSLWAWSWAGFIHVMGVFTQNEDLLLHLMLVVGSFVVICLGNSCSARLLSLRLLG